VKNKMLQAFTLVEVLFAVLLITTIGMALLKSSSNNSKLMVYNTKKKKFIDRFSIFAINMNDDLHKKSKTFYALIYGKYKLDDETRKILNEQKYELTKEDMDTVTIKDSSKYQKSLSFNIKKYKVQGKYSSFVYSIANNNQ
jgi:hypothetical protein